MLGASASEDVAFRNDPAQVLVGGGFEYGTGHSLRVFGDTHLAADGGGGACVVTGDHLDANAGPLAGRDSFDGLRPGRIDDTDQPHKRHALVEFCQCQVALVLLDLAAGGGKDPQTLAAKCIDLLFPEGEIEWLHAT